MKKGTRLFIAVRLLKCPDDTPSAVFDMESFFWTLVYVILHQNLPLQLDWDAEIYRSLVPEGRTYAVDSRVKSSILDDLKNKRAIRTKSVFKPYEELVAPLASLALDFYAMTKDEDFSGYTLEEETDVINESIKIVGDFLARRGNSLPR